MRYLPVYLDAHALPCLIVGGGEVAARKLDLLLRAGGVVRVVAPELCASLAGRDDFEHVAEPFREAHLADCRLAIAATDDHQTNAAVAAACTVRNILVNVVDEPALCTFIVPAIVDRSPLLISVSTGGAAPVLATRIRSRIESLVPAGHAALAAFMGAHRGAVKAAHATGSARRRFWQRFLDSPIPALLGGDVGVAEAAFAALLGEDLEATLAPRQTVIELTSADPADLTLRALSLLSDADTLVFDRTVPAAIRRYARRDAVVIEGSARAAAVPATGHTVRVQWRDTRST